MRITKKDKFNRENVGALILALRNGTLKIKQDELSKNLGITQGTISKIENGSLEIGISLFSDILKYFDLNYDEFSLLLDEYIKETLKAQKLKIIDSKRKKLINEKVAKKINSLKCLRSA